MENSSNFEPMLDMFIFETHQLIEQLEFLLVTSEKTDGLESSINEIFRIMHTIKGSSAMMCFHNISILAHTIEDVFYFLRENKDKGTDYFKLTDIILESTDFIKNEVSKIEAGMSPDGDPNSYINSLTDYLSTIKSKSISPGKGKNTAEYTEGKQALYEGENLNHTISSLKKYNAVIFFEDGCEMENVRAFTVIHNIKDIVQVIEYSPKDISENEGSAEKIKVQGFEITFCTEYEIKKVRELLEETVFLRELKLEVINEVEHFNDAKNKKQIILDESPAAVFKKQGEKVIEKESIPSAAMQTFISVNVSKMDKLMDLVGEMVIAEAMVTQNSDLKGLQLENFSKAARQLKKITSELQSIVMSIRMVPLESTFLKMNRIVRDISKKLNKEVELSIKGQETEVDKNIIEHISDPLMHLIRNSLDHGIESAEERLSKGKPPVGRITLEAKNAGGDVWIIVRDDGQGLDKEKIYKKAFESGFTNRPESELSDKEIYSYILLPGFSTKDEVSEFSGRGVGMDVAAKNIESIGGRLYLDSVKGQGITISIKIPLTLAIIDGMNVKVGDATYTVPIASIRESFRVKESEVIKDIDRNEIILVRGECYPVVRLNELFNVRTHVNQLHEGIIMMVENESKSIGIFTDALLGEQQVVVKPLPGYVKRVKGVAGCTLLGDGSISLILDVAGLIN